MQGTARRFPINKPADYATLNNYGDLKLPPSKLSCVSVLSLLSVASLASALSLLGGFSFASAASLLSIGSVASVLSVGSAASVLSIGSIGCVMAINKNCVNPPELCHDAEFEFHVHITDEVWATMDDCSFWEYKSDDRPDKCDYQKATCTLYNSSSSSNVTSECKVRRKGSATWRGMSDKPSLKVKKFEPDGEDAYFGTFPCTYCPVDEDVNVWRSSKVTLNNQVQGNDEVDAYSLFRAFMPAPLAVQTVVKLFKGDDLFREDSYLLLETIDDKKFMRKWFRKTYILYENEFKWWKPDTPRVVEFERFEDDDNVIMQQYNVSSEDCANLGEEEIIEDCLKEMTELRITETANERGVSSLLLQDLHVDSALKYYAAELSTGNWDGACHQNNNYYIAYDGAKHFLIPSGLDQTLASSRFVCNDASFNNKYCGFMNECMLNASCALLYSKILPDVLDKTTLCGDHWCEI